MKKWKEEVRQMGAKSDNQEIPKDSGRRERKRGSVRESLSLSLCV